jgi:predicted DNA-binding transcriptional regulator AlpA
MPLSDHQRPIGRTHPTLGAAAITEGDARALSGSYACWVAERLGLSTETVLRRYRSGDLPGFRLASNVLRFDEGELSAWLEAHRGGEGRAAAS